MSRINIFGCSEVLLGKGPHIQEILSLNSPSIGVNHFPIHYSDVDYWIFNDVNMVEKIKTAEAYKGQQIITNRYIAFYYLNKLNWDIACIFEPNDISNCLLNSGWLAVYWAIINNYTDIYLYGILDGNYNDSKSNDINYKNLFESNHIFKYKKYLKFKDDIENNFYTEGVTIHRPLYQKENMNEKN